MPHVIPIAGHGSPPGAPGVLLHLIGEQRPIELQYNSGLHLAVVLLQGCPSQRLATAMSGAFGGDMSSTFGGDMSDKVEGGGHLHAAVRPAKSRTRIAAAGGGTDDGGEAVVKDGGGFSGYRAASNRRIVPKSGTVLYLDSKELIIS